MRRARWFVAYAVTAGLGLGMAYLMSLALMAPALAQSTKGEAPSDGALPPEFMKEIEGGGGSSPGSTSPAQKVPSKEEKLKVEKKSEEKPAEKFVAPPPPPPPPPSKEEIGTAPSAATQGSAPVAAGTAVTAEEYVYDPAGRRDPFRPYRMIRSEKPTTKGPKPVDEDATLEPLQRFDLEQLTIMGILWDVKQPRALVRDGEGKIHTIVKNTKMGRHSGYVAAIREGEIVVIETMDEEGGKSVKKSRIIEFRKRD